MKTLFALLTLTLAAACAHLGTHSVKSATGQSSRRELTEDEARSRSRQVSQVRYGLFFGIDGNHDEYEGRAVIQFFWRGRNGAPHPLFLDFAEGKIEGLRFNGVAVSESEIPRFFDGSRIELPEGRLAKGTNRIELTFTHAYSRSGTGLHRFVDPEDKNVYIYSQSEPFDANRIFPCFDQPDLKASFELTVEAPQDWAVISNVAEKEVVTFDQKASWQFPPSPAFSTYLFALHAGPYEVWKSEAPSGTGGIPLRIYARDSLKKYVDADEWFEITRAGLDLFGDRFGIPYPFGKYDQVIVPEFPAGAMENVGAVTFAEHHIFKSKPTGSEFRARADTILHEMAHMWFGNLVTMRWWDGLWLNESFATYAASWALEKIAEDHPRLSKAPWAKSLREDSGRELLGEKQWAYFEDASRNTHPIEMKIDHTGASETVFDGITYAKGAAVIKQLVALVGEDDFTEGLRRYFEAHSYKTATTSQFLKSIEEAASQPLGDWRKQWLQSPGANRAQARWACDPETRKITSFELVQSQAPQSTVLRRHRTRVGLGYGNALKTPEASQGQAQAQASSKKHRRKSAPSAKPIDISIKYAGELTSVPQLTGAPCPDFVFPNVGDDDYVQVILDPASRTYLRKHLSKIESPLLREQIWSSLWHSLIAGELKASEFADWFFEQGAGEKDPKILSSLLRRMLSGSALRGSIARWLPSPEDRQALIEKLGKLARRELTHAAPGTDLQRQWWHLALEHASQSGDSAWIGSLLAGKTKISGLKLEQDRRWELLHAWAVIPGRDQPSVQTKIDNELKRDPSDDGHKEALSVQAAVSRIDAKDAAFTQASSGKLNFAELGEVASSFQLLGQEIFVAPFVDRFLVTLPEIARSRPQEEASLFAASFFPATCEAGPLAELRKFMSSKLETFPLGVRQSLIRLEEEEDRCLQQRAAGQLASAAQSASSKTTGQ